MSSTVQLIDLLGAGALLIWGLKLIKTGVLRAFGASLRQWIRRGTGNRFAAATSGFIATLAMQSSTATAVITASFASRGLIELNRAQAVMLGANVGTALAALVLSLDVHWFGSAMILIGVITSSRSHQARGKGLGRASLGLGLMLLALHLLSGVSDPLRESATVKDLMGALGDAPLLAVIVAAALAFVSSSSLAVVLFVSLLVQAGVVAPALAVILVAGANLGGAIPPFLAVSSEGAEARRVTLCNLFVRVLGAGAMTIFAAPIATLLSGQIHASIPLPIITHLAFNLALLVIFLPILDPLAALARRVVPTPAKHLNGPSYLDEAVLATPSLALVGAARESLKVGDLVNEMLDVSLKGLTQNDTGLLKRLSELEEEVDGAQEAIKLYLSRIDQETLNVPDARRCEEIISYAVNLEHIGDIIHRSLGEQALKKSQDHLSFSPEGSAEIMALYTATMENLQLSQSVFLTRDPVLARRLALAKVEIRQLEAASSTRHMQRMRERRSETLETSSIHLDILRDLKRINAHLASVAVQVLEQAGGTSASRLLPRE